MFVNIGAIGIVLLLTLRISVNYLQINLLIISFYSYFQNLVKKTSRKSHNHREGLPKTPKKDQTSHKLFLNKVITMTAKTDQKTTIRYQYRTKYNAPRPAIKMPTTNEQHQNHRLRTVISNILPFKPTVFDIL